MDYELKGFFFGNFSLLSKKNCPAQYKNKLRNISFLHILCRTGTFYLVANCLLAFLISIFNCCFNFPNAVSTSAGIST